MVKEDHELLERFLTSQNISILNTRCFKRETGFLVTIASENKGETKHEFEGHNFTLQYGEFSFIMKLMNQELINSLPHVANDH